MMVGRFKKAFMAGSGCLGASRWLLAIVLIIVVKAEGQDSGTGLHEPSKASLSPAGPQTARRVAVIGGGA